jgi:lipopolysaccharide/colanic/teichoic acid biosynthesis glycosyltransferase
MLPGHIRIKFHAKGSSSIVGSDSKDSSGESVSKENGFKMSDPHDRRLKRLADAVIAFIGLITFPIQLVLVKHPFIFFGNCLSVLFGKKTWIGYAVPEKGLPLLKPGVLACNGIPLSDKQNLPTENLHMMDYWYARDYELVQDLKLLWRKYRRLGG